MKEQQKAAPRCLIAVSALCGIAGLILYLTNGTNKLSPDLSMSAIIAFAAVSGIGVIAVIAGLVTKKASTLFSYAQYIAGLVAFAEYLVSQANYIANVVYGVDGNTFTPAMIATAAVSLLAWVLALAAAIQLRRAAYRRDLAAQEV